MSRDRQGARRTITTRLGSALQRGVLVVVPIALTLLVAVKIVEFMRKILAPVAHLLPDWVRLESLVALVVTLFFCMIIGFIAESSWGGPAVMWFDERVMGLIPGYRTLRAIAQSFFGNADSSGWLPALIRTDETWQAGFIVESHADGRFTVFVPGAPTPTAGDIHIIGPERVRRISSHPGRIFRSLTLFGAGVERLKKEILPGAEPADWGD